VTEEGKDNRSDQNPVPLADGVFRAETGRETSGFRCGYAAIIGLPNVGKSTLLNAFLKQKISIVTPKPQTTRHRLLGILTTEVSQIVFLDTPGLLEPKYLLHERMMEHVALAIGDADVLLVMVDATAAGNDLWLDREGLMRYLNKTQVPSLLLLNKVDRTEKLSLLPMIERFAQRNMFREIFPVSALKGDGTDEVLKTTVSLLPVHPPLYPDDVVSEQSERFFVSEIVREKVFLSCKEEVPYSTTVDVIEFRERGREKTYIRAEIYVERPSQRGIIVGKGGAMLKRIGAAARKDAEAFLQRPIYLELHVKVRDEWRHRGSWLDKLGYKTS